MDTECISYKEAGFFSQLILDYIDQKEELSPFYNNAPDIEGFAKQLKEKSFDKGKRVLLKQVLFDQYTNDKVQVGEEVQRNINSLGDSKTFTVTTGHQLCLFTGPLYFIYKIISTIKLSKELKAAYPEHNFVPIYWMASEDHDFDEINFFNLPNGQVKWETNQTGAVGRMKIDRYGELLDDFETLLTPFSTHASELIKLFKNAYSKSNLAAASRDLVNGLFGQYGLVIVDGDDAQLKRNMIPMFKDELENQSVFKKINQTTKQLGKKYKTQVNPREINLFYLEANKRERIEESNGRYSLADKSKNWSQEEILKELNDQPENFSPNVVLRPLYQEEVLPNLAYIGGGGELAYWFQLKSMFDNYNVPFPILVLRNSALFLNSDQQKELKSLDIDFQGLFNPTDKLVEQRTILRSSFDPHLDQPIDDLKRIYDQLEELSKQHDLGLEQHIRALRAKHSKNLDQLSKKLIRSLKKKESVYRRHLENLKSDLFPEGQLQERYMNFTYLYLVYGQSLMEKLLEAFDPLGKSFTILKEKAAN